MNNYIELHIHTTHTAGNSVLTIDKAVQRAKTYGMASLGIMDSGTMSGVDTFVAACRDEQITPIVGCGFYLTLGDHRQKADQKYHLPVIAENDTGLVNLRELDRIAQTVGNIGRPQIDLALLAQYHKGLIVFTGGRGGAVDKLMKAGHYQGAEALLLQLKSIVGAKNLFVELQDNGRVGEMDMNRLLGDLAKKCQVECVVTGGPFYLDPDDAAACNALREANGNNLLHANGFNFRSGEEQAERFGMYPEAVENSVNIAKRCSFL
ncbi:PHP domain-containing protein [Desulfobacter curvatus]|uniref:PHP domain-containing protein n=1 Tax=Desulfobacter curvatus TaxID=2290 RepID=UPI00037B8DA4|nr:PHP domain-containing protein [Desulfobacter curvatus]